MKSGFQAATGPSLPWPGKERAGAERSPDPVASSTGSSRPSSPSAPGASSQLLPVLLQPYLLRGRKGSEVRPAEARLNSREATLGESSDSTWGPLQLLAALVRPQRRPRAKASRSVCAPLPRHPPSPTLGLAEDPCRMALSPDLSGCFSSCRGHSRLGIQICWASLLGWTLPGHRRGARRLPRHRRGRAVGEGAQTLPGWALTERPDPKQPNCFF